MVSIRIRCIEAFAGHLQENVAGISYHTAPLCYLCIYLRNRHLRIIFSVMGMAFFPLYPSMTSDNILYMLNHFLLCAKSSGNDFKQFKLREHNYA